MFQLISDGGCDFTKEETQVHGIDVIPFYISFDQETHLKEGVDITREEYFKRLKEDKGLFPKTAQPSPQDYIDVYTPHLEAGRDIMALTISSKLSGSYNSAILAANIVKEDYPDRAIIVIDSLNSSVGQGLILRELIKVRDKDYSATEAAELAAKVIKTTKIYFAVDNLEYLKRGGRVGPTTALVGGILGLRPVLHLVNGAIEQLDSIRGKKRVLQLIVEGLAEALKDEVKNANVSIGHVLCKDDAAAIKTNLEASLGIKIANPVAEVGMTIGAHVGPGALAVAYCKKYETFVG